jgi:hypothetical protein
MYVDRDIAGVYIERGIGSRTLGETGQTDFMTTIELGGNVYDARHMIGTDGKVLWNLARAIKCVSICFR